MSFIFRRVRGRIIPIRTDGARKKDSSAGEVAAKTIGVGATAGGAGYFGFRRANSFFTAAADRMDKWLGVIFKASNTHLTKTVSTPPLGAAGAQGRVKISKPPRLKKDGTPYASRKGIKAVEPLPGQRPLFGDGPITPINPAKTMSPDDFLDAATKAVKKERDGMAVTRFGRAAKWAASKTQGFKKYSPVAAGAIGLAAGAAVLYDELKRPKIKGRRK